MTATLDWFAANADRLILGTSIAAGLVGIMLILRWIGEKIVARDPDRMTWQGVVGSVLARTSLLFMIAAALEIVMTYADAPSRVTRVTDVLFIVAAALQAAVWARELIIGAISRRVGEHPGETTLGNALSIIRVLVSVALFAIAVIVILDNLGVNVTALVAGLGIGGIAIGLAAQGIFSDLFAALAIVFDKPFRRGDTIRYGGVPGTTGTVERIGLKTTRLRSVTGQQVIMANTKLLEQEVQNLAEAKVRRVFLPFSLTYQTPAETFERLPEIVEEAVKPLKACKLFRCVATQFGPSSIDCELVYDDRTVDQDALARHKSVIITGVIRVFAREGIAFAYPTQTTFTAAPDGTLVMPWAPPAGSKPSKT